MREIFLNIYGRKRSPLLIVLALTISLVNAMEYGYWTLVISFIVWVFVVPSAIWLMDDK